MGKDKLKHDKVSNLLFRFFSLFFCVFFVRKQKFETLEMTK
jgi:hypothetical protein